VPPGVWAATFVAALGAVLGTVGVGAYL